MIGDDGKVLLTLSQVKEWEEEGRKIDAQIANLQNKRAEISKKLDAVKILFPKAPDIDLDFELKPEDLVPKETMVEATLRILKEANSPLNNSEIKAKLSEIQVFKEKLANSPNYFYTMMNRQMKKTDDTRVIKIGDKFTIADKDTTSQNEFGDVLG